MSAEVPITYKTYQTVFIKSSLTGSSVFGFLREFIWHRALKSKTAMIWIILSTTFIVSFPTIASAMTGYSGNSKAYVRDENGNLVQWNSSSMPVVGFIIHDGNRVTGLWADYPVIHDES
jgi:hypothetical protein